MPRKLKTDARNTRRRERYAEQKEQRLDAQAGKNALRNVQHLDGFYSQLTGAGISGVDKFKSYDFAGSDEMTDEKLECLYLDNDVAATIVERPVLDALRGGYGLTWQGATDDLARDVVEYFEEKMDVTEVVKRARIYSRLLGGGAAFLGIPGSTLKTKRPDDEAPDFLRPVASKDLEPAAWYADPAKQNFSRVAIYDYNVPAFSTRIGTRNVSQTNVGNSRETKVELHESYVIPFYGVLTTDDRFRETGWGDSVLRRVYDALLQFEAAYMSVLHTLSENSIPVYKVEGLLHMLAAETSDLLQARFQLINAGKSNYRAIVLGENEEFLRVNAPLQEAANVVQSAMQRVAGAAGMPMTVLWGMSPAGMNATGQSDLEIWNQQVAKEQSLVLGPALLDIYQVALLDPDSPLGGDVPEDLEIKWPSLWTPSLQDEVNNYAQVGGADVGYINAGVLKPEVVLAARSGQGQFPNVPQEMLDAANEALEAGKLLNDLSEIDVEAPDAAPEAAVGSPAGLDTPEGAEPQKAALNGAQIKALQDLAIAAADGTLPVSSAKAIAASSFPLDGASLEAIFADFDESKFEEEQNKPEPVPPMNPLAGLGEEPQPPAPGQPPQPEEEDEQE